MSTCPNCGGDPWRTAQIDKWMDRYGALESAYRREAAEHAVAAANWRLRELERAEDRKGLQRKVAQQRKTIRRLEEKLRTSGVQPYADQDAETAGGCGTRDKPSERKSAE